MRLEILAWQATGAYWPSLNGLTECLTSPRYTEVQVKAALHTSAKGLALPTLVSKHARRCYNCSSDTDTLTAV